MKIFAAILVLFAVSETDVTAQLCEIRLGGKTFQAILVEKTRHGIVVERNGKRESYQYDAIQFKMLPHPFHKVLILENSGYIEGELKLLSLDTISIEKNNRLIVLKTKSVTDIIDPAAFHSEMDKTKQKALYLSLLYPGLGQLYTSNRVVTGASFMMGFSLSVFLSAYFYRQANDNYTMYEESRYGNRNYYDKAIRSRVLFGVFAGAALVTYSWSVLDSYFNFEYKYDAQREYTDGKMEVSLGMKY